MIVKYIHKNFLKKHCMLNKFAEKKQIYFINEKYYKVVGIISSEINMFK